MNKASFDKIDIIGDIHGHYEELCKLLEKLGYLFEGNKYIEFGKECKTHSDNFLWDKIIENYKGIL